MRYDPARHHRRSLRLPSWDYRWAGAYFVTLTTHEREMLFGEIVDGELMPSKYGEIAMRCWQEIPAHFPHVELDEWVLMPDHLHGIIVIVDELEPTDSRGEALPCGGEAMLRPDRRIRPHPPRGCKPGSLGAIVGSFKSVVTRRVNELRDGPGAPVWQRNYYEHIIRNARELRAIRRYIQGNPYRWKEDQENLVCTQNREAQPK